MISKQDVRKLSELTRIEVTDAEAAYLQNDLERILSYVEKLNAADTQTTEEMGTILGLSTIMREDTAKNVVEGDRAALITAAPSHEKGFVKTKEIWKGRHKQ